MKDNMGKKEVVSVIIPTFKRPQFICKAIDSCYAQEGINVQVIVVDDNGRGTDAQKSVEKLVMPYINRRDFKYLIHDVTRNGSAARNTGIRAAEGDYVAFLDDDDWFEPNKLIKQVRLMEEENTHASLVGFRRVYNNYYREGIPSFENASFDLLRGVVDSCAGSGLVVTREMALRINGFDESFIRLQDVEFLYRISKLTKISVVNDILLNVRMHGGNIGKKTYEKDVTANEHFLEVFKDDIASLSHRERIEVLNNQQVGIAKGMIKHKKYFRAIKCLIKSPNPMKNTKDLFFSIFVYFKKKA